MATDIKYLRSCGISAQSYKRIFTAKYSDYPEKVKRLINLINQRTTDGKSRCFLNWHTFAAIDIAFDPPQEQTTPTMINHILSQGLEPDKTMEALREWGLKDEDLFLDTKLPDGKIAKVPNPPVFYQIIIPIVRSYVMMREAKLFNERNVNPLLPYAPLKETARNQVLCEIITDLVQTMSTWYGYAAVIRQAIHQCLKYGLVIAFPEEEWHYDEQEGFDGNGSTEKRTIKEGIRYILPHPTRMFWDMRRPLSRLNSDTGCEYMGTWYLRSYGDILDDDRYWNRKRIFCGTNWLDQTLSGTYFQEFYPCRMKFPVVGTGSTVPTREDVAAWYTSNNRDQAVFLTEFYMKINPAKFGLGEYKNGKLVKTYNHPVWHHFTLAGDDTVVWAEPCAYCPCWFMGYDWDDNASRNSSLAQDCLPWESGASNILSQIMLTAQQNLANVTFYDTNIVNEKDMDKLRNLGEARYRGMPFIPYDSLLYSKSGLNVRDGFTPVQLTKQQVQDLFQVLTVWLNVMDRVLQISPQESGGSASHQQSKAEVMQTGGASTNRVVFVGSGIDEGIDAMKRQLYDALMAYMDPKISAEVSADIPDLQIHLQELGFSVSGKGNNTVLVTGQKHALRLEGFAGSEANADPGHEKEMAQVIFQVVGTIAGQEKIYNQIGVEKIIELIELGAKLAGAPRGFRITVRPGEGKEEDIPDAIKQAILQAQKATLQFVEEKIAKPAAQEIAQDQQQVSQIQQVLKQLQGIYEVAAQTQDKNRIAMEKAKADVTRKDFVATQDLQRKAKVADAELQIQEQVAKGKLAIEGATAAHGVHLAEKAAVEPSK